MSVILNHGQHVVNRGSPDVNGVAVPQRLGGPLRKSEHDTFVCGGWVWTTDGRVLGAGPNHPQDVVFCGTREECVAYIHGQTGRPTHEDLLKRRQKMASFLEGDNSPPTEADIDSAAVDTFALLLKGKLAAARAKGRGGWHDPEECSVEYLAKLAVEHMKKGNAGNFLDVAAFMMMLHLRHADPEHLVEAFSECVSTKMQERA